jgi:hypothetical protein
VKSSSQYITNCEQCFLLRLKHLGATRIVPQPARILLWSNFHDDSGRRSDDVGAAPCPFSAHWAYGAAFPGVHGPTVAKALRAFCGTESGKEVVGTLTDPCSPHILGSLLGGTARGKAEGECERSG